MLIVTHPLTELLIPVLVQSLDQKLLLNNYKEISHNKLIVQKLAPIQI
jgi:hypothetical protein